MSAKSSPRNSKALARPDVLSMCGDQNTAQYTRFTSVRCPFNPVKVACGRSHIVLLSDQGEAWVTGKGRNGELGFGPELRQINEFRKISIASSQGKWTSYKPSVSRQRQKALFQLPPHSSHSPPSQTSSSSSSSPADHAPTYIAPPVPRGPAPEARTSDQNEEKFIHLACGPVTTAVITQGNDLYLWGYFNDHAILQPEKICHLPGEVDQLSVGNSHLIFLIRVMDEKTGTYSHRIYTYGRSKHGALGLGETETKTAALTRVSFFDNIDLEHTEAGFQVLVTAGSTASGVLTGKGELYVFGLFGSTTAWTPTKVQLTGIRNAVFGDKFHLLVAEELLYFWGNTVEIFEQDDSSAESFFQLSRRILGNELAFSINLNKQYSHCSINDIRCNRTHIVLSTTDGKLFSMGRGEFGKLGLGDTTDRLVEPVLVEKLQYPTKIKGFSCTSRSTCLLQEMPIFGGTIDVLCPGSSTSTQVPPPFLSLVKELSREDRLPTVDLFKDPGNINRIGELALLFEQGSNLDLSSESSHDLAGLLLSYICNLRKPLIPPQFSRQLQDIVDSDNMITSLAMVQDVLLSLPTPNKTALEQLLFLLQKIVNHGSINGVKCNNLAAMFLPGIFEIDDALQHTKHATSHLLLMRLMIQFADLWFNTSPTATLIPIALSMLQEVENSTYVSELVNYLREVAQTTNLDNLREILQSSGVINKLNAVSLSESFEASQWDDLADALGMCLPSTVDHLQVVESLHEISLITPSESLKKAINAVFQVLSFSKEDAAFSAELSSLLEVVNAFED